jgi:hypothetical protein
MRIFASTPAVAGVLALASFLVAVAGLASAKPTDAQLAAIKANCRSDFMSNCWGVPRGGAEAFQCLKDPLASLSDPCRQAVKAVIATATPPAGSGTAVSAPKPDAETKPAAAASEPATSSSQSADKTAPAAAASSAAATPPSEATADSSASEQGTTQSNVKAASGSSADAATSQAKAVAKKPSAATSNAAAQGAGSAAEANAAEADLKAKPAATQATAPLTPAATGASTPSALGFIPPRKKFMLARACRADFNAHCPDVDVGGGRAISCLEANKASLTPDCRDALTKLVR